MRRVAAGDRAHRPLGMSEVDRLRGVELDLVAQERVGRTRRSSAHTVPSRAARRRSARARRAAGRPRSAGTRPPRVAPPSAEPARARARAATPASAPARGPRRPRTGGRSPRSTAAPARSRSRRGRRGRRRPCRPSWAPRRRGARSRSAARPAACTRSRWPAARRARARARASDSMPSLAVDVQHDEPRFASGAHREVRRRPALEPSRDHARVGARVEQPVRSQWALAARRAREHQAPAAGERERGRRDLMPVSTLTLLAPCKRSPVHDRRGCRASRRASVAGFP